MIISHKHKFIFIKSRKTAGSSIQAALAIDHGPDDIITGGYRPGIDDKSHSAGLNMHNFFTNHEHAELKDIKAFIGPDIWNSYFKFSIVRNPYDIAVSRYHWDSKKRADLYTETSIEGFRNWIKNGNLYDKDRVSLYIEDNNKVDLDYIVHYENLEDDLEYLCKVLNIPKLILPGLKTGFRDKTKYTEFYDDETKEIVYDFFKKDFDLLNYTFDNKCVSKRKLLITNNLFTKENNNIGTPSLITVPDFIQNKLGKYYLYFSNHEGTTIKMAFANDIDGPWTIIDDVLNINDTPCKDHIASPEIFINHDTKELYMYYHGFINDKQGTLLSKSTDGIHFKNVSDKAIANFYLRVFEYKNQLYGLAKNKNTDSIIYKHVNGEFLPVFNFLPSSRHCAVLIKDDKLYIFYSRIRDIPEHIRYCIIKLDDDIDNWEVMADEKLLSATFNFEGSNLPIIKSEPGSATSKFNYPINEIRDPFIFEIQDKFYILYTVYGERAIAYGKLINF